MTNQQKADYAAAMFQLRAIEKGYSVSKPITETGVRYDYILDDGVSLKRACSMTMSGNCFLTNRVTFL